MHNARARLRSILNLGAVLLGSSTLFAQNGGLRFSLTDLAIGPLKNQYQSQANAINDFGTITGSANNNQFCFTYRNRGKPLGVVIATWTSSVAANYCAAAGINSYGDVGGSIAVPNVGSGTSSNAFLRTYSNNVTTLFPSAYGNFNTHGYGIDDYKEVVGEMDAPSSTFATRWSANGTAVILDYTPTTQAVSTTPTGSQVLVVNTWASAWTWPYGPSLQNPCGQDIFFYSGAMNANAHAVGQFTCFSGLFTALWVNGVATALSSSAWIGGISNDDWVVGWTGSFGTLRVSDPNCPTPVNINTLLDASGAGWTVTAAYGINSSHQIVGEAVNSSGPWPHAVLLTPINNLPLCWPD